MARNKPRKVLKEGDRATFYFKKGFPSEMLDWVNAQSDMQLLFEYALDHLYQKFGQNDIASILPRTYEIGQGLKIEGNQPVNIIPVKNEAPKEQIQPTPSFSDETDLVKNEIATTLQDESEELKPEELAFEPEEPKVEEELEETHVEPEDVLMGNDGLEKDKEKDSENAGSSWGGLDSFDDSGYM